jgi:hypothetical protein
LRTSTLEAEERNSAWHILSTGEGAAMVKAETLLLNVNTSALGRDKLRNEQY